MMLFLKPILQIGLIVFSGWFGEWPFIVSAIRAVNDWRRGGLAFPRMVGSPSWRGVAWAVKFYRGSISRKDFLGGIGLLLIPALFWVFYELLKSSLCICR
jgi:hypothetical protein